MKCYENENWSTGQLNWLSCVSRFDDNEFPMTRNAGFEFQLIELMSNHFLTLFSSGFDSEHLFVWGESHRFDVEEFWDFGLPTSYETWTTSLINSFQEKKKFTEIGSPILRRHQSYLLIYNFSNQSSWMYDLFFSVEKD